MESKRSEHGCDEDLGRWLDKIRDLPDVRAAKIERIRQALQNRSYENEFVLDQTVERLSREVATLD